MPEAGTDNVDSPSQEHTESAAACANCGDPRPGNYCPNCGQRRGERRISTRRMLAEALEDQLSVNAALPRTLRTLLLHPGKLTQEYMAGRVQRYIPPFRLYLVTSLVFFLLLSFMARSENFMHIDQDELGADTAAAPRPPGAPESPRSRERASGVQVTVDNASGDSTRADTAGALLWGHDLEFQSQWTLLDDALNRRLDALRRMPIQQAMDTVFREAMRRAPTAMFLLLPIFAALLKLLYIRRRRFYVEHFVFCLHTHAFAFLLITIMMIAGYRWIVMAGLGWMVLYLYIAMKRFYAQGWLKTLIKYFVLAQAYFVLLTLGMTGAFLAALLLS